MTKITVETDRLISRQLRNQLEGLPINGSHGVPPTVESVNRIRCGRISLPEVLANLREHDILPKSVVLNISLNHSVPISVADYSSPVSVFNYSKTEKKSPSAQELQEENKAALYYKNLEILKGTVDTEVLDGALGLIADVVNERTVVTTYEESLQPWHLVDFPINPETQSITPSLDRLRQVSSVVHAGVLRFLDEYNHCSTEAEVADLCIGLQKTVDHAERNRQLKSLYSMKAF